MIFALPKPEKEDAKSSPEIIETHVVEPTLVESCMASKGATDVVVAKDFLRKHIEEIKRFSSNKSSPSPQAKPVNPVKPVLSKPSGGFDLELYVGDKLTTKKLLDPNSKYVPFSPATATSQAYKRKLDEIAGKKADPADEVEDKKAKKLKQIDDILNIKSNHAKDASNPDKNPQLRATYDKMGLQEAAEDRLCSIRNREVRVVTCNTCAYTAFSQSDCKFCFSWRKIWTKK